MFWVMQVFSWLLGAYGVLSVMGGAMSDAPALGDSEAKAGGIMVLIALALCVGSLLLRFVWKVL